MSQPDKSASLPAMKAMDPREKTKREIAWVVLIICPIIALLPPRRLSSFTMSLLFGHAFAANYLWTGVWPFLTPPAVKQTSLPTEPDLPTERAREFHRQHQLLKEAKLRQQREGAESASDLR